MQINSEDTTSSTWGMRKAMRRLVKDPGMIIIFIHCVQQLIEAERRWVNYWSLRHCICARVEIVYSVNTKMSLHKQVTTEKNGK
jgi:hypothetical protein